MLTFKDKHCAVITVNTIDTVVLETNSPKILFCMMIIIYLFTVGVNNSFKENKYIPTTYDTK